jgi:hypothetical protein
MRIHFVLNHGGTPESKLADVELHFEEGPLAGIKLVGCSVWRSKKNDEKVTVLLPARSFATSAGPRYFDLMRDSEDKSKAVVAFKKYIKGEYLKIVAAATPTE